MYTQGNVESLRVGQSLLVGFKATKNPEKVQMELAEIIRQPNAGEVFNASDPNWGGAKARRAWRTITIADTKEIFPELSEAIDKAAAAGPGGPTVEVNILNPQHPEFGQLHLRVVERTVSEVMSIFEKTKSKSVKEDARYQLENLSKTAKRAGSDGEYLTHFGEPILSRSTIEFGKQAHRFLPMDVERLAKVEDFNLGVSFGEPVEEEINEEVEAS